MKLDSDVQAILDQYAKFEAPGIETLSPENARNIPTLKNAVEVLMMPESAEIRAKAMIKPMPYPISKITHQLIPGKGGDIVARIYTPHGEGSFPVLLYFHGGGYVIANLEVYESSCRALCNKAQCIVVAVAYRQSPENKYPAALEDAYAATQWVMENADLLNGDSQCVAIAGESAGANLATVVCLKARDEGQSMPVAQLLLYPITDARMNTASYKEDVKPLNAAMMAWFWKQYLEDKNQGLEPYASPLLAKDLSGLPPAIVFTAQYDPLRDEGEAYAVRLKEAGVTVKAKRFDGVTHEFFSLAGVVHKSNLAVEEAAGELKRIFEMQTTHHK